MIDVRDDADVSCCKFVSMCSLEICTGVRTCRTPEIARVIGEICTGDPAGPPDRRSCLLR